MFVAASAAAAAVASAAADVGPGQKRATYESLGRVVFRSSLSSSVQFSSAQAVCLDCLSVPAHAAPQTRFQNISHK